MSHLTSFIAQTGKTPPLSRIFLFLVLAPFSAIAAQFVEVEIGADSYRVEIADTPAARRQGLMHRQHLQRYGGMLLVYTRSGDHRIWMKNVKIPLRVYWIDSGYEVIEMRRLEPCHQEPCEVYSAAGFSKYVLELSDHEHDLKPGDRIEGLNNL